MGGSMTDSYDEQLSAARYRAERDQARQELARLKAALEEARADAAYYSSLMSRYKAERNKAFGKLDELGVKFVMTDHEYPAAARTCRIVAGKDINGGIVHRCSSCGKALPRALVKGGWKINYCPKCGAKVMTE